MSYDPAYLNTASCRSTITYIDGDAGILRYRGYPIEQLAEEARFLETAYLLLEGELPTSAELAAFEEDVRIHTYVHTNVQKFLEGFRYDAHPMGMLLGAVGALSTFYPGREANRRRRGPQAAARPAPREAADDRGVRLPPLPRPAVRAAPERSRLHRELREHDVRDRRPSRAEPGAPAGARDPPRAARRPRAELLDERRAGRRLVPRRPLLRRLGRDRGALRPAPRRRQRGGPADARRDRGRQARAEVHRGGQGGHRAG